MFCSSGQLTALKIARPVPIEPILDAIREAREAGATHLTFLGGEPTLHKRFLDALRHAVDLGFQHIVIFTNGVMFPHPGFIESICELGSFEWRISIQGATDEAHVATTGRADSFRRILHGLGELQRRGQLVTANMCVNERSFRSLPEYPELMAQYGVRQLHVDIVRPESTGERDSEYLREIMPRYSGMAPYYTAMLEGFERLLPDFDINVGNLPYCVLPAWGNRIHHGGQETVTKSSDGEGLEDEMNKYEWQSSLRAHLPACTGCVFRPRCTGVFRTYLELHGDSEFQTVTHEVLERIDPHGRNFQEWTDLARQRLDALSVAGWNCLEASHDGVRGSWQSRWLDGTGSSISLHLRKSSNGSGSWVIARGGPYELSIDVHQAQGDGAIQEFLEAIRIALDVPQLAHWGWDSESASAAAESARFGSQRARVATAVRSLQYRFQLPGWRLLPLRWVDARRCRLPVSSPVDGTFEVEFELDLARGVRTRFCAEGMTAAMDPTVRAVGGHLLHLMKSGGRGLAAGGN